jgi:hypothetical protein
VNTNRSVLYGEDLGDICLDNVLSRDSMKQIVGLWLLLVQNVELHHVGRLVRLVLWKTEDQFPTDSSLVLGYLQSLEVMIGVVHIKVLDQ